MNNTCIEKLWTQNTRIIHDIWRLLILSNEEKRMIMKILKKEWLWKFWKKGVRRKRNPCPIRLWFWQAGDRTYDIPNFSHTVISDRAILTIKLFRLWYISNYSVFLSFNMSLEEFVLDFCTVLYGRYIF